MPVDPAMLPRALEAIKNEYGSSSYRMGHEQDPVARISTGNIELDYATNGGIPIGRWTHGYGGYSSCKTLSLAWNTIRRAQEMGMTVAYYNMEKQYDKDWVSKRGVDVKNLIVVEGTTIEGTGAKLEALMGSVHLHVLDSMAVAVSIDALNADVEDWQMGLQARAWGKVIQRVNERFDENENTVVMINQVRDVFGRGGGESPPGGRSIDFISSLSLHFRRSSWLFHDDEGVLDDKGSGDAKLNDDKQPDGMEFVVRVIKSRVGPPLRTARLRLDFTTGEWDNLFTLAKAAEHFNVVETTSKGRFVLPGGEKIHGKRKLRDAIEADRTLQQKIKQAMFA